MIVDELILKLKADLADVKKGLAQVKADAEKAGKEAGSAMGKQAGTSFGDVFNAIAGAAVLNTVRGFFSKAAQEFNKMESAMMRVDSIAKGFGRSVDTARKQVTELADKGFLNLNQAASSYANTIALGFDEKQARKFIDALSDISAFQTTLTAEAGGAAAAVESGVAGLLSNSAEKVENIGVPLKLLNMEYQKNIATMGKAVALQKFYGAVLKESEKFSGDAARSVDTLAGAQNKYNAAVDKSMVAIGKGLEPALKGLYATGQKLFEFFAKWFESLDSTTKTLVLAAPAVGAFVLAIGAMVPVLKAISLSNPFGWIGFAIGGLIALAAALNEVVSKGKPENIVKAYKETREEIEKLGEKQKALSDINIRTIDQELALLKTKEALREKAKALGIDYDDLTKKAKNYTEVITTLTNAERDQAAARIDLAREAAADDIRKYEARYKASGDRVDATRNVLGTIGTYVGGGGNIAGQALKYEAQTSERLGDARRRLAEADLQRAKLYTVSTSEAKKVEASLAGSGATEQRFIESANKIRDIEKNRDFTILKAKRVNDEEERKRQINAAIADADLLIQAEFTARRHAYAEYIEDKYMADTEALKQQTDDAIRASNETLEAEIKQAKGNEWEIYRLEAENEGRIQKIREANARKQATITLQSFADTANAANATASGFASLLKARDAGAGISGIGGVATGLSGLKNLFPALGALGPLGAGIGAIGGLVSTLSGLFGKSDEQRAQEAQEQARRDEETKKILELQANYQKSMLALQEAAAKLPFEKLQRELRLIDINAQQESLAGGDAGAIEQQRLSQRQAALQSTFTQESGTISGGQLFGNVQATPDSLIEFLNERNAESLAIAQFQGIIAQAAQGGSSGLLSTLLSQAQSYSGKIPDKLYQAGIGGMQDSINYLASQEADYAMRLANWRANPRKAEQDLLFGATVNLTNAQQGIKNLANANLSGVNALVSEVAADTSVADNLLSTLEQSLANQRAIADSTKKTAENTSKALELRPDRERSFVDVGMGFIQSLGQKITSPSAVGIAQSLRNFTVPTEVGTATLTASRARTLQERMADATETLVSQGDTANSLLSGILRATLELYRVMDGNPGTVSTFDDAAATAFLSDRKRRSY